MGESSDRNCSTSCPPAPAVVPQSDGGQGRGRLKQELVRALDEDLGGFQLLDHDVTLAGDAHLPSALADLVGLDRAGRLVLVVRLEEPRADAALAQALDLAALAEARRSLLERHLAHALAPAPCLVVLVGAELPDDLVRRARMVGPDRLRLLEVRELRSASGVTTCFVAPLRAPESDRPGDIDGFIGALPAPLGERAASLVERLRRLGGAVDGRLGLTRTGDGLEWRIGATTLCTLGWRGDQLVGRIGAREGSSDAPLAGAAEGCAPGRVEVSPTPLRTLSDGAATEAFLDAALGRFLALAAGAATRSKPDAAPYLTRS